MRVYHPEFEEMHIHMRNWCERQAAAGWSSADVEKRATYLKQWLWSMARTKELGPVQFEMLAAFTDNFERARSGAY